MTIAELISELEQLPQDTHVYDEYGQDLSNVTFTSDHANNVAVATWVNLEFGGAKSDTFEEF
jgi:hypothetical protein